MRRTCVPIVTFAVVLGACSGTVAGDTTTTAPTSTTTTTTAVTTTTTMTTTTTVAPSTTTTTARPAAELPETFVAITTDYEAVEVATATGGVVRSLGRVSDAEDVRNAECAACVNALDAVWRTSDGTTYVFSECCEPAAGAITVLDEAELPLEPDRAASLYFWTAAPGPDGLMAYAGYTVAAGDPRAPTDVQMEPFVYANGVSWIDASTIAWLDSGVEGPAGITVADLASGDRRFVAVDGIGDWRLGTFTATRDGDFYIVRHEGQEEEIESSVIVVVNSDGDHIEREVEPGAVLGGFDPSGTFLIYTGGDGIVRFRGGGRTGVLGEGFFFASW